MKQPFLIMGDLNGVPEDFDSLNGLMDGGQLHDLGAMGTKAGEDKGCPTCCADKQEIGSRRDVVLASTSAVDMVREIRRDKGTASSQRAGR